jgi:serine phosphatase RsbU (regulator of sigma subunit)
LQRAAAALEQLYFLEGFLPPPESPYLLPCVELPSGRAADVHLWQHDGIFWVLLLDATTAREATRRLQQKAYDMTLLQEREALLNKRLELANSELLTKQRELEASRSELSKAHEQLRGELAEAALYVGSLLPEPLSQPFAVEWLFKPSTLLGGDAFGYHWIDEKHFAIYLLDVCGHGVGPSLFSVAVLHLLQSMSLREIDFRRPQEVSSALNGIYQMEGVHDLYFTLWYGVYQPQQRRLEYSCAGHLPALLVAPNGDAPVELLKTRGLPIGLMPDGNYVSNALVVPPGRLLYLLSDGVVEVERADGSMQTLEELLKLLVRCRRGDRSELEGIYDHLMASRGSSALEDDFSIVCFAF